MSVRDPVRPLPRLLVLVTPERSFATVRRRPLALALVMLSAALAALPGVAFVARTDLSAFLARQMKAAGQDPEALPQEARAALAEKAPAFLQVVIPLGGAAKRTGFVLVISVLGFALLRGSSPHLRFREALAAVALATLPLWLADGLTAALFFTKNPMLLDVDNPLMSNPAAWLGRSPKHDALGAALRRVDLFQLWSLVLIATGLREVARAPRAGAPWALVGVAWVLLLLLDTSSALFSQPGT